MTSGKRGTACFITYTPESRDSRTGKAREILYVRGRLEESARGTTEFVIGGKINVISRDFFDALSTALQKFLDDLETDPSLSERVTSRSEQFLVRVSALDFKT